MKNAPFRYFLIVTLLLVNSVLGVLAGAQQPDSDYPSPLPPPENRYAPQFQSPPEVDAERFPVTDSAAALPSEPSTGDPSIAQVTFTEGENSIATTVTQAIIDAKVKEITDLTTLDEAAKKEALERLKSATEWLKVAKEAAEKPKQYEADMLAAPEELRVAKETLAKPRGEPQLNSAEAQTLKEIEQAAAEADARLKQAKETLVKKEETLKRRGARKTELTKLIPETEKAFEEAKKSLAVAQDINSPIDSAKRLESEAKFLALEKQRTLFPLESKRIDTLADLAPLQRDVAKREVEFAEKDASTWQKFLVDSRKRDSDRQAEKARRQLQDADPALKTLAGRNTELAERRKSLVAMIEAIGGEVQTDTTAAEKIENDFKKMEEKVEKAGNSTTIGLLLRRKRDQLPDLKQCRDRLRFTSAETPAIHLSLLELQDEEELLDDRDAVVAGVVARLEGTDRQYDDAYYAQMVTDLLTTKKELLDTLIGDHDEYLRLIGELEVAQNELIAGITKTQAFIDERVLWIRSSDPIGITHFSQAWSELQHLGQASQWAAVMTALKNRVVRKPLLAVLASLVVTLMLLCRQRFQKQLNRICEAEPETLLGRFTPTIEAIVASALATAFWPGLVWLVGWQLRTIYGMPELGVAVGLGLQSASYPFWLCRFARQLFRRGGIAERHFDWNSDNCGLARRNLSWLTGIGIPCIFFISAVTYYRDGEWSTFLGRIGFLIGMIALVIFAHSTLRVRKGHVREPGNDDATTLSFPVRTVLYFLGIGGPIALGVLAALGYFYTAQQIALRLQATLNVILVVILVRALALRWLAVRMYRLQQKAAAELAANPPTTDEGLAAANQAEEQTQLSNTDSELRYLLRYVVAAALLVGGFLVWSDVTPALSVLDRVEFWSKSVEVKKTVTNLDGEAEVVTSHEEVKTTLKHGVLACMLLVLGLLVARNLPALVDVLVLERMPIDKGQRYAAAMILRYMLTLATIATACLVIGLNWSSIQWLAAAMTVGLGFGLQEIFANLVSGLIILFERPIRVGDLITVGGVSGRVTRMQIRATTITGFDRKELIVPNKKFITEDVMNWTLTDDVNRVELEVGVAYGSDTELARELLLKVARRHPFVMAEPEPLATFDRFSDSSLNFTLRCFLPNLENRLAVIHDLHTQINEEFQQADIEIAFPQQDLHVRTIDAPLRSLLRRDVDRKGAA